VPFDVLRSIRTELGREIDNPVLAGSNGALQTRLRQLYGALTDDLNMAAASGGPEAKRIMDQANRYTRFHMSQNIPTLQKIVDSGTDEQVYNLALRGAADGGTQLRRLRRNFKPEEWDNVAGAVLGRMGLARPSAQDATGEAFSVSTFLTNWNKLSPEAKKELFGSGRHRELMPQIDRLARVVGYAKDVDKLANTSGTARHLLYIQMLGGAGVFAAAGPGTAIGSYVGPWAAAKLITNPRFARWLADASTDPAAIRPNGIMAQLARLKAIASQNPDIAEVVDAYIQALTGGDPQGSGRNRDG
jgi:hypothetical protein